MFSEQQVKWTCAMRFIYLKRCSCNVTKVKLAKNKQKLSNTLWQNFWHVQITSFSVSMRWYFNYNENENDNGLIDHIY